VFSDKLIRRFYVDAFWQGSLVDRTTLLHVDGARCYLPDAWPVVLGYGDTLLDSTTMEVAGYTAAASEVTMARLLNDIHGRPEPGWFDGYMRQAHITEVPE
jgi:hypothetical protein